MLRKHDGNPRLNRRNVPDDDGVEIMLPGDMELLPQNVIELNSKPQSVGSDNDSAIVLVIEGAGVTTVNYTYKNTRAFLCNC